MGKSYRTKKPSILASERIRRNKLGIEGLRIIERKPRYGDMHPLSKRDIMLLLNLIPDEYLYGLKRIELRARTEGVGKPFGVYLTRDNVIRLYSLPLRWEMKAIGSFIENSARSYGAEIEKGDGVIIVEWKNAGDLAVWFFIVVLAHELGHHYRRKYRHRNGRMYYGMEEEYVADLHSYRIKKHLDKLVRDRRNRRSTADK